MAYAIVASKWLEDKRYIEAVLDSAADLAALGDGYAPDSRAIVAEGGAAYMTDASGHWQELGSPGGGGSSITVEPLTVAQNGTTTAPSGKAYSPVTVDVPNPNYVETISGTVANPFGSKRAAIFAALPKMQNGVIVPGDIDAYLSFHTTAEDHTFNIMLFLNSYDAGWYIAGLVPVTLSGSANNGPVITYIAYGENAGVYGEDDDIAIHKRVGGTVSDLSVPGDTPCTLTIIHHPMPDSE